MNHKYLDLSPERQHPLYANQSSQERLDCYLSVLDEETVNHHYNSQFDDVDHAVLVIRRPEVGHQISNISDAIPYGSVSESIEFHSIGECSPVACVDVPNVMSESSQALPMFMLIFVLVTVLVSKSIEGFLDGFFAVSVDVFTHRIEENASRWMFIITVGI